MAKDTAKKSTKPRKNAKKPTKAQIDRDARGRFLEGFSYNAGNSYATKYDERIPGAMEKWFDDNIAEGEYPMFEGFAAEIRVTMATMIDWCSKYPSFLTTYELCKQKQENFLGKNGLKGRIDTNFSKFIMNVYHNKTEKKESDVNLKGGADFSVSIEVVDKVGK